MIRSFYRMTGSGKELFKQEILDQNKNVIEQVYYDDIIESINRQTFDAQNRILEMVNIEEGKVVNKEVLFYENNEAKEPYLIQEYFEEHLYRETRTHATEQGKTVVTIEEGEEVKKEIYIKTDTHTTQIESYEWGELDFYSIEQEIPEQQLKIVRFFEKNEETPFGTDEFHRNMNGNLLYSCAKDQDGKIEQEETYVYNGILLVQAKFRNSIGETNEHEIVNSYNNKGNIVLSRVHDNQGKLISWTKFSYDDGNRLIEQQAYNGMFEDNLGLMPEHNTYHVVIEYEG